MKKILVLSTDTIHHRYFINQLEKYLIGVVFEKPVVFPESSLSWHDERQARFEEKKFMRDCPCSIGVPIIQTDNVNDASDKIQSFEPDLGISFGTKKLALHTIQCFKDGIINVHRGISRKYRGLDSELWAIYHKDFDSIGVTIHKVDLQLDTGDIVHQSKLKLEPYMRTHQLRYYMTKLTTNMMKEILEYYQNNILKGFKQERIGRYYGYMCYHYKKDVSAKFNNYCERLKK